MLTQCIAKGYTPAMHLRSEGNIAGMHAMQTNIDIILRLIELI